MGTKTIEKNNEGRFFLHIFIAVALWVLLKFLVPAANGLTEIGVDLIAVFIPILYLWITVGTHWPSFLALALIGMTGVMSPPEVYSKALGNPIIMVVIAMMAISKIFADTGVIDTVVKWSMTRELIRNRPYVFLAMIYLVGLVLCMLTDTGAIALVFITLCTIICKDIGYEKGDPFYTALMLGVFWVSNIGNAATPFGHALPLIMINNAKAAGNEITFAQWTALGVPFAIAMYIFMVITVCFIWKPESSKFKNYDIDKARKEIPPLTKKGKVSITVFALLILYWLLPSIFPGIFPDSVLAVINKWGNTVPAVIAACLLCIIHVDDEPVAKFREMTSTTTVTILLFIGTVTALGSAISHPDAGISLVLNNLLRPITANLSPFIIVTFAAVGCIILTNFISNTVTMLLFYSLTIPVLSNMGGNIITVTIIIGLLACFGSLVPSSAVTAPFFFGKNHITVKNAFKWNIIMMIFAVIAALLVVYPLGSAMIG